MNPMAERRYYVIDAFANERFQGNPAAVVLDSNDLNSDSMQAIAAEFNLSETTFVLPNQTPEAACRFRWFTPAMEVDLCGHATIAGAVALFESGHLERQADAEIKLVVDSRSGHLGLHIEALPNQPSKKMIWLDLPTPTLDTYRAPVDKLASALGLDLQSLDDTLPVFKTQDQDLIVFVADVQALNTAAPDFADLRRFQDDFNIRGVCLASLGTITPTIHVQSRFFAPAAGVNEDPVTGSVHGPLCACLVMQNRVPLTDGLAGLQCTQGIPGGRSGVVFALVQPRDDGRHDVRIGGQAQVVMEGTLRA